MGDNVLKEQVKNFKKRKDLALANACQPALFCREDSAHTKYAVVPVDGESFNPGETLMALLDWKAGGVAVIRGNRRVGYVEGEGGSVLADALATPAGAGAVLLRVCAVGPIVGTGFVEVVENAENGRQNE